DGAGFNGFRKIDAVMPIVPFRGTYQHTGDKARAIIVVACYGAVRISTLVHTIVSVSLSEFKVNATGDGEIKNTLPIHCRFQCFKLLDNFFKIDNIAVFKLSLQFYL